MIESCFHASKQNIVILIKDKSPIEKLWFWIETRSKHEQDLAKHISGTGN